MRPCSHVNVGACHHGMARHRIADGGDGLKILTEAADVLNKQSWKADMEWPFTLGVGRGAKNFLP